MLEQKEPKIQDKPDRSARFVGHHTVMQTLQMALQAGNKIEIKADEKV